MKRGVLVLIGLLLAGLIGLGLVLRVRLDRLEGYYAPIYARDASAVYYVRRTTSGISWGLGYEYFSSPAHVFVLRDRFELRRLQLADHNIETLKSWPASPLEGRHLRHYRGRLYALPRVRLQWAENGELEYTLRVSLPKVPSAEIYGLRRRWNNKTNTMEENASWQSGHFPAGGYNEDGVRGGKELLAPPGEQYYPAGIIAYDKQSGAVEVLLAGPDFAAHYANGVPEKWLQQHSRHAEVTRLRDMRSTYARLKSRFKADGLNDGQSALKANKEMQRLGYFPKDDTIKARRLSGAARRQAEVDGRRLFAIADKEMQSGIFPDIEAALRNPDTEVEKSMGRYLIHSDFETSAKLNALIASGETRFYVAFGGETYEVTIKRY